MSEAATVVTEESPLLANAPPTTPALDPPLPQPGERPASSDAQPSVGLKLSSYILTVRCENRFSEQRPRLSFRSQFLAAMQFGMAIWTSLLSADTVSFRAENAFTFVSVVCSVALFVFAPIAVFLSFICQSSRAKLLFSAAVAGSVLALFAVVTAFMDWLWFDLVDSAFPSRSVVATHAVISMLSVIALISWIAFAFGHTRLLSNGLPATLGEHDWPALRLKILSVVVLAAFIPLISTFSWLLGFERYILLIANFVQIIYLHRVSFYGGPRMFVLLGAGCSGLTFITQFACGITFSVRALQSPFFEPAWVYTATWALNALCCFFSSFASFAWAVQVGWWARHSRGNITEEEISAATSGIGDAEFPRVKLIVLGLVVAVLSLAQMISAIPISVPWAWGPAIFLMIWAILAVAWAFFFSEKHIAAYHIITVGVFFFLMQFFVALQLSFREANGTGGLVAVVFSWFNWAALTAWLAYALIWFAHAWQLKSPLPTMSLIVGSISTFTGIGSIVTCIALLNAGNVYHPDVRAILIAIMCYFILALFWAGSALYVSVKIQTRAAYRWLALAAVGLFIYGFVMWIMESFAMNRMSRAESALVYGFFSSRISFGSLFFLSLIVAWLKSAVQYIRSAEDVIIDFEGNSVNPAI